MDKEELFTCCQEGNLDRLRYLVEEKDVDLNSTDILCLTPLQHACIYGHDEVVQYLLENGAKVYPHKDDGEQTFYSAFCDNVNHHLMNFKVTSSLKQGPFSKFLKRTLEVPDFYDVEFVVEKERVQAHKLILTTRSTYFRELFNDQWRGRKRIDLANMNLPMKTFKSLLEYLYVGQVSVNKDDMWPFVKAVKRFKLNSLLTEIRSAFSSENEMDVLCFQPKPLPQEDFMKLFLSALPKEFQTVGNTEKPVFVDLHIIVKKRRFLCHKVLVCGRCSYLRALCADHFFESYFCQTRAVQMIRLHDTDPALFVKILQYIYTDTCDLSPENALDVLSLADIFMLPGLKRLCASNMVEHLTTDNVVSTIKVARLYNMCRLEEQCTKYICEHLEEFIDLPDFRSLVLDDANENRQAGTIPVIASIRHHIYKLKEIETMLTKINQVYSCLEDLKLKP